MCFVQSAGHLAAKMNAPTVLFLSLLPWTQPQLWSHVVQTHTMSLYLLECLQCSDLSRERDRDREREKKQIFLLSICAMY
jgi:hypothetical protein